MPETHDIGPYYWHLQRYPDLRDWEMPVPEPLFRERAFTNEIDPPYRRGTGWSIRFWPTRWAIVIGRWSDGDGYETAGLERATEGRMLDTSIEEIQEWPGAAPDELPDELADSDGVVSWRELT